MATSYIVLKLTGSTRVKYCDTAKAYAIKYYKDVVFISKKYSRMLDLKPNDNGYKWAISIEEKYAEKYEDVYKAIMYIQELNEYLENEANQRADYGLEMVKKYINRDN